jgi:6-pyruvoyltetrahydropterin/6-carboxytetrahydropterin synthase
MEAKSVGIMEGQHVTATGKTVDFDYCGGLLADWVANCWNGGFLVSTEDKEMVQALQNITGQKIYKLKEAPSTQNMASFLLTDVCPEILLDLGVTVTKIRLWETENEYAEVSV